MSLPELRSIFCLSSSSLRIFSSSSDFIASNSNVRSLCSTNIIQRSTALFWVLYMVVSGVVLYHPVLCLWQHYLQVLLCSLHFTLMLVFDHLQTQLSVHSCKRKLLTKIYQMITLCELVLSHFKWKRKV